MKTRWIATHHGYMQIIEAEFDWERPELTREEKIDAALRYMARKYAEALRRLAVNADYDEEVARWENEGGAIRNDG